MSTRQRLKLSLRISTDRGWVEDQPHRFRNVLDRARSDVLEIGLLEIPTSGAIGHAAAGIEFRPCVTFKSSGARVHKAMIDHKPNKPTRSGSSQPGISGSDEADKAMLPADGAFQNSGESAESKRLTAEEQMALFEKQLKEDDWGHQPC